MTVMGYKYHERPVDHVKIYFCNHCVSMISRFMRHKFVWAGIAQEFKDQASTEKKQPKYDVVGCSKCSK